LGTVDVFLKMLLAMMKQIGKSVFNWAPAQALNQSAVFLLAFLLVHMLGNLAIFAGSDALNFYGHKLTTNPLLTFIEMYLFIGFSVHAVVGVYLTWKFKKLRSLATSRMFLSSIAVTSFVAVHVYTFRYGAYEVESAGGALVTTLDGVDEEVRDLYKLEHRVFADPIQAFGHALAVVCLGYHLSLGWSKAVYKLGLAKEYIVPAGALGRALVFPLCGGFAIVPMYVWFTQER
jgi:succinate dehydrogenase / fumarate reductase cytochrome b subunit